MLKELFENISAQAVAAAQPRIVPAPQPPGSRKSLIWTPDGIREHTSEVPPRNHQANNLATVAAFVDQVGLTSELWVDRTQVVCIICHDDFLDRVTMSLELSPHIQALQKLEASKPANSQRQAVFFLRTTFDGCFGMCPDLIGTLRENTFLVEETGGGSVQHGKVSLGKSARASLDGRAPLPESFVLDVPVFANRNLPYRGQVKMVLEPIPETQNFQFFPFPGEIEKAIVEGEARMSQELSVLVGDKAPIYYGVP